MKKKLKKSPLWSQRLKVRNFFAFNIRSVLFYPELYQPPAISAVKAGGSFAHFLLTIMFAIEESECCIYMVESILAVDIV